MTNVHEIFKPITGFNNYEISNFGNVKSLHRIAPNNQPIKERILKQAIGTNGYKYVNCREYYKSHTVYVHRLVAKHFIDNPYSLPQVNHKDGDKFNNCVSNLEWCDQSHNMIHAYKTGLQKNRRGENNPNYKHGKFIIP